MDKSDLIKKLDEAILKSIDNGEYSLSIICESVLMSRSQLHRRVKRETGLSTTLYIRKVRLEKAKSLLTSKTNKISDIAMMIGIISPQNFSKYFMEAYGITPSQFRKQNLVTAR